MTFNEAKELSQFDPVTYIPAHAKGDINHPDVELGVFVGISPNGVRVMYCKSRTVQLTRPEDLVIG